MYSLEDRVAWALGQIKKKEKITNIQLSKILEVDKNTVQIYCHGKGTLKGSALAAIVKIYGFNGEWLMAGKGEPFPGASEKFPEVCGPPGITKDQEYKITQSVQYHIKEAQLQYKPNSDAMFSSDQKINIEEAMGKTYKVLSAGTALSVALYMNIQQFATALDTGIALQFCQDQIKVMQEQIDALNAKYDRLSAAPAITEGQGDGSGKKAM